eukprot:531569_1
MALHLVMACLIVYHICLAHAMEDTIFWSDSMDTHNQDNHWILYGSVNTAIHCPLDPKDLCWNIIGTSVIPDPYIYRITDLSSADISTQQRLTVHYNIIPWDLQSNTECRVFYAIIPLSGHANIEWIPIAYYNSTHNALNLSSHSNPIPIHNIHINIAIKFMLHTLPNTRSNSIDHSADSSCYLSSIQLAIDTERFDANSFATPKIEKEEHTSDLISGNMNLDIILLISVSVLCIVLCAMVAVAVCSWCYKDNPPDVVHSNSNQNPHIQRKKRVRRNASASTKNSATPKIHSKQRSPTSWTGATAHLEPKGYHHRASIYATTTATPDREPSFEYTEQTQTGTATVVLLPDRLSYSKGLSQVVTKSAHFYRYDTDSISPTKTLNMNEGRITPRKRIIFGDYESRETTVDIETGRWREWEDDDLKEVVLETGSFRGTLKNIEETSITAQSKTVVFTSPSSANISMRVEPRVTKTYSSMYMVDRGSNAVTPREPLNE